MNVEVGLCEPDMLPWDYEWRKDFDKVILDGNIFDEETKEKCKSFIEELKYL